MFQPRDIKASDDTKYFPAFDYLRLVLAAVVAASHTVQWSFDAGNFAVQVFFAMSGWLIGGILLRSKPSDLPRFYFNRSTRIWIPYFVAVAGMAVIYLAFLPVSAKWLELTFYKLTFVFNYFGIRGQPHTAFNGNHLWSICAEEQFYLVAPLLIVVLRIGRSPICWLAIYAASMLTDDWNFFASISLGVLAATIQQRLGDWHQAQIARLGLVAVAIVTFAAIYTGRLPYPAGAPICAVATVLALAQHGNRSSIAGFLGGISYPVYLNHWFGLWTASVVLRHTGHEADGVLYAISATALAIIVGAVMYLAIDRVVMQNRAKYFTKRRGATAAALGYSLVVAGVVGYVAVL